MCRPSRRRGKFAAHEWAEGGVPGSPALRRASISGEAILAALGLGECERPEPATAGEGQLHCASKRVGCRGIQRCAEADRRGRPAALGLGGLPGARCKRATRLSRASIPGEATIPPRRTKSEWGGVGLFVCGDLGWGGFRVAPCLGSLETLCFRLGTGGCAEGGVPIHGDYRCFGGFGSVVWGLCWFVPWPSACLWPRLPLI